MPRPHFISPVLFLALLIPACAGTRYGTAALGNYDAYEPFATMNRGLVTVEIAREAHLAVVSVQVPRPGYETAPVIFDVVYPHSSADRTLFPPGRHRMSPRPVARRAFRECEALEKPSLDGCRRRILPGLRTVDNERMYQPASEHHVIVVAADQPVDPYTLAEALYFAALENEVLAGALRRRDAPAARAILERTLLDQNLATGWAGVYLTSR
jgi:hypothetical protein